MFLVLQIPSGKLKQIIQDMNWITCSAGHLKHSREWEQSTTEFYEPASATKQNRCWIKRHAYPTSQNHSTISIKK